MENKQKKKKMERKKSTLYDTKSFFDSKTLIFSYCSFIFKLSLCHFS